MTLKNVTVPEDQFIQYPGNNITSRADLVEGTGVYDVSVFVTDVFGNLMAGYESQDLVVTYDDIESAQTIVLHTVQPQAIPQDDQARAQAVGLIFSEEFEEDLQPTFE
ncbi:MAG: hypothetical protein HN886_04150 [Woeseiaceae bacterium]|nr:hypothetical protein [Woeseiaceae bacterium]